MDLSKVVTEPHRKNMEVRLSKLWLIAFFEIKSKILSNQIEDQIKHHGHIIGITKAEYLPKNHSIVLWFKNNRATQYIWEPETTKDISVTEYNYLYNETINMLWSMMRDHQREFKREMMH